MELQRLELQIDSLPIGELRDQLRLVNQAIQNLERLRRARTSVLVRIFQDVLTKAAPHTTAPQVRARLAQKNPQEARRRDLAGRKRAGQERQRLLRAVTCPHAEAVARRKTAGVDRSIVSLNRSKLKARPKVLVRS